MKFLLVYPPSTPFFITQSRVFYGYSPPLGLLYIAKILENQGDRVNVLDFSAEPFNEHVLATALREVDAVGVSVLTPSLNQATGLITRIKEHDADLPVIIGGPHCTLLPEQSLRETQADICVQGDGEEAIVHIRSTIQGKKAVVDAPGVFHRTKDDIIHGASACPIRDINALPFPSRHLVAHYAYHGHEYNPGFKAGDFTSLIASRGCPYHCRFCSRSSVGMRQYRARAIDNILLELREISEQGYCHVGFVDDCFPVDTHQAHLLFRHIIEEHLPLRFSITATRVDLMDKELFEIMKRAGVTSIQFGLESGNQDVLDYYRKQITVEMIRAAVRLSHATGLFTAGSFIFGAPFETKEHFARTLAFAKSLPLDSVSFVPLRYMVGSELWDRAVKEGALRPDEYLVTADKDHGLGQYTKEELMAYCYQAQRAYYLRPRYFMNLFETSARNNDWSYIRSFLSVVSSTFSELFSPDSTQ
ncbi:MAG TPA: radical SAM protein [Candidatus Thermoplasmatota archaeon]|nr:radical SAM protein [Candidatus Thermoplasmatota archaeon]